MSSYISSTIQEIASQIILLNQSNVAMSTQVIQLLTTNQQSITIQDSAGNQMQTVSVGYLQNQIDMINKNIMALSGLTSGSATITDSSGNSSLVIKTDLDQEGQPIDTVTFNNTFVASRNFAISRLTNPSLSIAIDLNGLIDSNVQRVMVRKFTIAFATNAAGTITTAGTTARNSFLSTYAGNNQISLSDWTAWFNANRSGIVNQTAYEDFDMTIVGQTPKYYGVYDVISIINNPTTSITSYQLNTLQYINNIDGTAYTLAVGDQLTLAGTNSSTIWNITSIDRSQALPLITVSVQNGVDLIPVSRQALKLVSVVNYTQTVNVPIVFDEYVVLFFRPINPLTNVAARRWSFGVGFWTNDLLLSSNDSNNGTALSSFYLNNLFDYSTILEDLVGRYIPTQFAITPNPPILSAANFQTVIVNSQIVNSPSANDIRTLSSSQKSLYNQIQQLQAAILRQQNVVQTTNFKKSTQKAAEQSTLDNMTRQLNSLQTQYASIVNKIAQSATTTGDVTPLYRQRGFWTIPAAVTGAQTGAQNVIQFLVQYKYLSPSGNETPTTTFRIVDPVTNTPINAAFSNWVEYYTRIRDRAYNSALGRWVWQPDNYGDVDQPNMCSIDLPFSPGEQIQIRIKSISEVGWPDAIIESAWSNTLTFSFPADLAQNGVEVENAQKNAQMELINLNFQQSLSTIGPSGGLPTHVEDSVVSGTKYFAHQAANIGSGFFDSNNQLLDLYTYINTLNSQLNAIQTQLNNTTGVLLATLNRNGQEVVIQNNQKYNISVVAQDYISTTSRQGIFKITDFSITLQNTATNSPLILMSNLTDSDFFPTSTGNNISPALAQATWADFNDEIIINNDGTTQNDYQWIWLDPNKSSYGDNAASSTTNLGPVAGQRNPVSIYSIPSFYNNQFAASVHPQVNSLAVITANGSTKQYTIQPGATNAITIPLVIYFSFGTSISNLESSGYFDSVIQRTQPLTVLTKTLAFQLNIQNQSQSFTFSVTFNISNYGTVPTVNIPTPPSLNPTTTAIANTVGRIFGKTTSR